MHAGFDTATDELMSGYITHIKPDFQRDPAYCTVEIWGMDRSVLMDREEKLRAWPQATDSAIATQLFSLYGFSSVVVETPIEHDEQVSTIIQRETDMQFLKRLALRNGYECYVDGEDRFLRTATAEGQTSTPPGGPLWPDRDERQPLCSGNECTDADECRHGAGGSTQ